MRRKGDAGQLRGLRSNLVVQVRENERTADLRWMTTLFFLSFIIMRNTESKPE